MRLAERGLEMFARKAFPPDTPAGGRTPRSVPSRSARARGFTLIELMVVVVIITVVAGLAAPTAVHQLRDRRVQEAARKVAQLYREARLQAVGRGAAVLLRFSGGAFTVLEAREGVGAACPDAPVASCLGRLWVSDPDSSRTTASYAPLGGDLSTMTMEFKDSAGGTMSAFEVCFSPNGRSFSRPVVNDGTLLTPLTQALTGTFHRPGPGRERVVVLLPNGTARMTAL
jgi:type II secretion system protein H